MCTCDNFLEKEGMSTRKGGMRGCFLGGEGEDGFIQEGRNEIA